MSLGWLVISREGCTWALPGAALVQVLRDRGELRVRAGDRQLVADQVLATLRELEVLPAGAAFLALAPEGCRGFAVWRDEPVVVVDPTRPPPALCADEESWREEGNSGHGI